VEFANRPRRLPRATALRAPREEAAPTRDRGALIPEVVARAFAVANAGLRVRVLSRLISSAGTLALAVVGGGVFFKFLPYARAVSLEDAARVTASQVYELARYVQQSNPSAIVQVMGLLTRDASTMSALGASLAAIAIGYLAERAPKPD
jgi:hypothetical protein